MKHSQWKIIFSVFVLSLFVFQSGMAQIEITQTVPVATQDPVAVSMDTEVDITELKLDQTGAMDWNFQAVLDAFPEEDISFQTINIDDDPFADLFPDAQWVDQSYQYIPSFDVPLIGTIPGAVSRLAGYYRVNGNRVEELGIDMEHPILYGSPYNYGDNPAKVYPYPLTKDSSGWLEQRILTAQVVLQEGATPMDATVNDSNRVEIDAWGQLTIPAGTFDCLRLKRHEFRNITVIVLGFPMEIVQETYTWVWITERYQKVLYVTISANKAQPFTIADVVAYIDEPLPTAVCDPLCDNAAGLPERFALHQNYPNPFNPETDISYSLPEPAQVTLTVYNLMGREMATLVSGTASTGRYHLTWNGRDSRGSRVPSGVYLYRLHAVPLSGAAPVTVTRKMILSQ